MGWGGQASVILVALAPYVVKGRLRVGWARRGEARRGEWREGDVEEGGCDVFFINGLL